MSLTAFLQTLSAASTEVQQKFHVECSRLCIQVLTRAYPFVRAEDAADAVAESLLALAEGKVKGFVCDAPPTSADYRAELISFIARRIAPRKLIGIWRKNRVHPDLIANFENQDIEIALSALPLLAQPLDPIVPAEQTQLRHQLYECISRLNQKLGGVIRLVLQDLSYDQIADAMSLASTGTVKSRVWTAMQRLKHCMGMSQGKEEVCDV